ncbi:MAG: thiol oxidoreductase [Leptospiraceae bacterium]|nr:thiol oxidoreductase [Leptospiraceae bacterium]MBL0262838.1 thiol oxidoreductase [Leptospiraceae bacterium]
MKRVLQIIVVIFVLIGNLNCKKQGNSFIYAGGETTVFDVSLNGFNRISTNVKEMDKILKFNRGNQVFKATWANDGKTPFQGLGPLMNSNSCNGCHFLGGRGKNKAKLETEFHSMAFKFQTDEFDNYGFQIQDKSIDPRKISIEAKIDVTFIEREGRFPDGEKYSLREPKYSFSNWNYAKPKEFSFSPRVAPVIYGMGLLSLIPHEVLESLEDVEDKDKDGISGKINRVFNHRTQQTEIGRFGWKANQPDIHQLIATALLEDLGITSRLFPKQNCSKEEVKCNQAQPFGSEIDPNSFEDLEYYSLLVGVPATRIANESFFAEGKDLFIKIGCASCHKTEFKTGVNSDYPELSRQTIHPYTDLLLHDMGEELSDGFKDGLANGREWRTSPLWGIGLYLSVSQHSNLLQDGRARDIQEAILWHEGESKQAKESYKKLNKSDREKVLKFLQSL